MNHALEQLAEVEGSSYAANTLSRRSNRTRRAEIVEPSGEITIRGLDIDTTTAY